MFFTRRGAERDAVGRSHPCPPPHDKAGCTQRHRLGLKHEWYYDSTTIADIMYSYDSLGMSGTRPGEANKATAMNSVTTARGYQIASLFCWDRLSAVAVKKASRTRRRMEMTKRM